MTIGYRTEESNFNSSRRMLNNLRISLNNLQLKHRTNQKHDDEFSNNSTETTTSSNTSNNNHQPTIIQRIRDTVHIIDTKLHHTEEDVTYVKVLFPTTEEVYEGPMIKGSSIRHGDGAVCTWPNGMKFLGRFENDIPVDGTLITAAYTYTGRLIDMNFDGHGVLCNSDGSTYEGEFLAGDFHGEGKYKSTNGSVYTGSFVHGLFEGIGTIIESDGVTYSGSWKRGMKDGDGNETLEDGEVYVGQFHRNKRNGNGCLTKDGVRIEGTFRAGKVLDGVSIDITYPDGRKYSGEALSCEPHGMGTMKYPNASHATDASMYTGEWSHGNRNGKGHCCYANGDVFDGYWENDEPVQVSMENMELFDKMEGITGPSASSESQKPTPEVDIDDGESVAMSHLTDPTIVSAATLDMSCHASTSSTAIHSYPNGDVYHGRVDRRRQRQGYGKYITANSTYEGMFKNSKKHGKGEYVTAYSKYDGEFQNDLMHGQGTLIFNDSSNYTGTFKDDVYHGKGTLTEEDGRVYKGQFRNGLRHGNGTESFPDCTYYDGEYKNNKRDGFGTLFSEVDQSILYTGLWKNDLYDGEGVQFHKNHKYYLKFEGSFLQGTQSGPGMLTLKDETILIGKWIRNSPTDGSWQITFPSTSFFTTYSGSASFFAQEDESDEPVILPHGEGVMNYVNGDVYKGNFHRGIRSGKGKCKYANGDVWDGTWDNDEWDNCVGVLTLADGTVERFD